VSQHTTPWYCCGEPLTWMVVELRSSKTSHIAFQLYRCKHCEQFYDHLQHAFTAGFPAVGKLFTHLRELRVEAIEQAYGSR
jgi:hypothetical protein